MAAHSLHRPIPPELHPLATGHYRIATPSIQAMYKMVERCLHYRIQGAIIYGTPRLGKTQAIEYVRLLLARQFPRYTSYHARCEHKPRHAEGPFLSNLLEAVGDPSPANGGNPAKRTRLTAKIREAAARTGGQVVVLFCDEAQRYDNDECEWLRDVHDALDRIGIRLFTFLVGQQELLRRKTDFQMAGKVQIVARLMVEEMAFRGIRSADEVATCLLGYDETEYPEGSGWSYTRFYLPKGFDAGYRLIHEAPVIWDSFLAAHHKANLAGALEIPMEYFARAVEIVLKDSILDDRDGFSLSAHIWMRAVHDSAYVQAQQASSRVFSLT
jgi:hypothetical protein